VVGHALEDAGADREVGVQVGDAEEWRGGFGHPGMVPAGDLNELDAHTR
jgi:hypothetical protein